MHKTSQGVKGGRTYNADLRQQDARRRHGATLEAAHKLFIEHGYAGTTIESIASTTGVSAATIYKTYGGKAGLVRTLCERALAGSQPTPAQVRSNQLRSTPDPREVIRAWGKLLAEVSPRISPLMLLLRDAGQGDAEAAALYDDLDGDRLTRMSNNAQFLADAGHLIADVTVDHARDILWLCSSAELYDLLVTRRSWTVERYSRFAAAAMENELIGQFGQ